MCEKSPWNLSSQPLHLFGRLRPQMSANVAIISGKADARELVPAAWGARQGGELSLDLLKNIQHWPLLTSSSTKAFSQNILSLFLRRNSPCDSFSWAFNQQCRKPSNSVTALVAFSKTVLFIFLREKSKARVFLWVSQPGIHVLRFWRVRTHWLRVNIGHSQTFATYSKTFSFSFIGWVCGYGCR